MAVHRKGIEFAKIIAYDRRGNDYVYGGNWVPVPVGNKVGTDCSGCVTDELDAAINDTAMEWTRHGLSTESWRPPSMGGAANPANGPFGTVMVDNPGQYPGDAAVLVAFHHGPGGGANSHTWCEINPGPNCLKVETNGDDGTVLNDGTPGYNDQVLDVRTVDGVNGQYGANNWWFLPGPVVEDGTPLVHGPSGAPPPATGEPRDTLFADVSEFQCPVDDSYWDATYMDAGAGPFKYRVLSIRSNDGGHADANFSANYAACVAAANDGRAVLFIVYYYWRPGGSAVTNHMRMVQAAGGPHPKMVSMIDLESGGNPTADASSQVNSDYITLTKWLGNEKRVIGYCNVGDQRTMWQTPPAGIPMILAGYGSNPNDPAVFKIAHQYTDGQRYGAGLPEGAPPFGNCDMNSADGLSPSQLAAALGVSVPISAPAPVATPPLPAPAPQPALPTYPQLGGLSIVDYLAKLGAELETLLPKGS
jgi:hypothetical protein